jgi:hypothetical protein
MIWLENTEGQAKEIKLLKSNCEEHRRVINMLTAKVITMEQCVEDVQRKAFPQVGGTLPNLLMLLTHLPPYRLLPLSLASKLPLRLIIWSALLSMVNVPLKELVRYEG